MSVRRTTKNAPAHSVNLVSENLILNAMYWTTAHGPRLTVKGRFTHNMPCPCRFPAMPRRQGFRMCFSHLIYTAWPCLIHTCHAMLRPCRYSQGHSTARPSLDRVLCCGLEKKGIVGAWQGHGMAMVNQTWPHCVNQMGKTHSKPFVARQGNVLGTAWA